MNITDRKKGIVYYAVTLTHKFWHPTTSRASARASFIDARCLARATCDAAGLSIKAVLHVAKIPAALSSALNDISTAEEFRVAASAVELIAALVPSDFNKLPSSSRLRLDLELAIQESLLPAKSLPTKRVRVNTARRNLSGKK